MNVGVDVRVSVAVGVIVDVGVIVGVSVSVGVGVIVGVGVGVDGLSGQRSSLKYSQSKSSGWLPPDQTRPIRPT